MKINQFGTQSVNPYQKNYDKQAVQKTAAQPQDKLKFHHRLKKCNMHPTQSLVHDRKKLRSLKRKLKTGHTK